ncbi:TniQ protein [Paenibacillus sp. BK033]|uniref:TniQ family protein n=1 Tax=Paenibacillus sp. BK033 TaxID=2512133 RepID=UPI0010448BC2|nr:TniQ family protein [Paenibacillus sp. BK033]TCM99381.1 TniQ protein [Paenibacillus sp. BK033]
MSILIRPSFEKEESLISYLYRLTSLNYYPSILTLSNHLGISIRDMNNNRFDSDELIRISELLNKCVREIENRTALINKSVDEQLLYKFVKKNNVKYCPACYQEKQVYKYTWGMRPLNLCMEHGIELLSNCSKCNASITIFYLMKGHCSQCSFPYSQGITQKWSREDVYYLSQQELYKLFYTDQNQIRDLNLNQYLRLAYQTFFLLEEQPSFLNVGRIIKAFPQKNENLSDCELTHTFANIHWMYSCTKNFHIVMEQFFTMKKEAKWYERKSRFEDLFKYECFSEIRKTYESYCLFKVDKGLIRKDCSVFKQNPNLLDRRKYVRKEEVIRNTKMSKDKVESLANNNRLNVEFSSGKYLVEKKSLNKLSREKLVTKRQASIVLGIHYNSIDKLVSAKLLTIKQSHLKKYANYSLSEIEELLHACRGELIIDETSGVKFYNALTKYNTTGLTIVKLIELIRSGEIRPIRKIEKHTLADLYLDETELESCMMVYRQKSKEQRGYYMKDVMKLLAVGEKTMRKLMDTKVMEPSFVLIMKDGRKRYFFEKERINQLRKVDLCDAVGRGHCNTSVKVRPRDTESS